MNMCNSDWVIVNGMAADRHPALLFDMFYIMCQFVVKINTDNCVCILCTLSLLVTTNAFCHLLLLKKWISEWMKETKLYFTACVTCTPVCVLFVLQSQICFDPHIVFFHFMRQSVILCEVNRGPWQIESWWWPAKRVDLLCWWEMSV